MINPVPQNINTTNLKEISSILNNNNIEYCVFFGTALGIYRDKEIIKYDDDIDFLVNAKDFEKTLNLLKDSKYQRTSPFYKNSFFQFSSKENNITSYIDFYFYEEHENFLLEKWNFNGRPEDPSGHILIPKNIILPIKTYPLQDFTVNIPNNLLEVCKLLYGPRFIEPLRKNKDYHTIVKNQNIIITYLK